MSNLPKRTQKLLLLLGLVVVAVIAQQLLGGGGEETGVPPASKPAATQPAQTPGTSTTPNGTPGGLPADPTSPTRPGSQLVIPSRFPGTETPVIAYNPFRAPPADAAAPTTP